MEGQADPLILNPKAARRLQLLFSHGARPQPASSARARDGVAQLCLAAGILQAPVPAGQAGGRSQEWLQARDPHAELAVHIGTLRALKVAAGCFVRVRNASWPEGQYRLARALPSPLVPPGTALLAPALVLNLGLGVHLLPLLLPPGGGSSGTAEHVMLARHEGPTPAPAAPAACASGAGAQQGSAVCDGEQPWVAISQPTADPARVPLAAAVRLAVVRTPEAALLTTPAAAAAAGSAGRAGADGAPGGSSGEPGERSATAAAASPPNSSSGGAPEQAQAAGDESVQALQQFFLSRPRVVCQGDVLVATKAQASLAACVLPNLLQPPGAPGGSPFGDAQPGSGAAESGTANGSSGSSKNSGSSSSSSGQNGCNCGQPAENGQQQQQQYRSLGTSGPGLPPQLVYFKVVGVQPEGQGPVAVDPQQTQVQLVGSCSSGVPPGAAAYLAAAGGGAAVWPSGPEQQQREGLSLAHPPSLGATAAAAAAATTPTSQLASLEEDATWRQLAQLLASALHPEGSPLPLRLAVLLHGPAGSGRQAAAKAAAEAVGCHVVPLSCHDIRPAGTPERRVLDGLRAAFKAAGQYRPAVLLLRHFDALGGDAGGPGGSDAFAARAGTVLAECIRAGFRPAPTDSEPSSSSGSGSGNNAGAQGNGSINNSSSSPASASVHPTPLVLVACAPAPDDVPPPLRRCFTHELAVEAPSQPGRQALLQQALGAAAASQGGGGLGEEVLEELARHTAGLLPREVRAVVADAAALAAGQALPAAQVLGLASSPTEEPGVGAIAEPQGSCRLEESHLSQALESVRQRTATEIGAPKIPNVKWEDVGGLEDVKRAILDTVELPLKHPELFAGGLRRRSGVLLYGPPGTGKTLLAKAVATECSINFLSVKGPELINMYVGESERQIREVFARARRARPCVVFFDELDSLAPARGKGSDSGGVMDRVVAQLLAEIDGVQGGAGSGDLFMIGATNRPDLLDPALLRPGRLDRLLYVGIAGDQLSKLRVLEALTRKFVMHPGVDLAAVAARCPARFTGADMYALCSDAWMTALRRGIAAAEAAGGPDGGSDGSAVAGGEAAAVVVQQSDFYAALDSLQPSLSEEDVRKYERIRDQYEAQKAGHVR